MKNLSLKEKRNKFHSSIRNQYHQQFMKKIRYQLLENQTHQTLDKLISSTQYSISQQQLTFLIHEANQHDQKNAIIHLGNLVIDGIVESKIFINDQKSEKKFQLRPKSSQYWPWLIRVLLMYQAVDEKLICYILEILKNVEIYQFALNQSLEIVKFMLKNYQEQFTKLLLFTPQYQGIIRKIVSYCFHQNKLVSCHCYQIIDIIIQSGQTQSKQLLKLCSFQQFQRLLNNGFSKFDSTQKKFPFIILRIINNIFSSNIMLSEKIIIQCIKISLTLNQKKNNQKTILQISYLWLSFFQCCSDNEMVLKMFQSYRILSIFQKMLEYAKEQEENNYRNQDEDVQKDKKYTHNSLKTIVKNVEDTLSIIVDKLQDIFGKNNTALIEYSIQILINTYRLRFNKNLNIIQESIHTQETYEKIQNITSFQRNQLQSNNFYEIPDQMGKTEQHTTMMDLQ